MMVELYKDVYYFDVIVYYLVEMIDFLKFD